MQRGPAVRIELRRVIEHMTGLDEARMACKKLLVFHAEDSDVRELE